MAEAGSSKISLNSTGFNAYNEQIQAAALKTTKLSVAVPSDINFHRSMNNEFAQTLDRCAENTLALVKRLLILAEGGGSDVQGSNGKGKGKLKDHERVVDEYAPQVVDVLDHLFERSDMSLDKLLGNNRAVKIAVKPPPSAKALRSGRLSASILHAANLPKPQLKFKRTADNRNGSVWAPGLKHKFNAQVPLGFNFTDPEREGSSPLKSHPYRYEIRHISYPRQMLEHRDARPPSAFEITPFTYVDTPSRLTTLLGKLRNANEIAVDLEYHSLRSFTGFTCLMQISTREEDFIIDTLALREEMEDLNEVFTDSKVVKVFHGAESDIVWLQQDFNIYVVNMFDTFHASKLLEFPKHSLASLLEMYCDFVPDKRYQLADWRIRPLPLEMQKYARSDTHFLLYIYDNLRNALLDKASGEPTLLSVCLERSQETALRVPELEIYDHETGQGSGGWNSLMNKWGRAFNGPQLAVFKAVHSWRDGTARREDESTRYVLPNHYLFQVAERMPADVGSLLAIFRPVPPLVRVKANEVLESIRSAANKVEERLAQDATVQQSCAPLNAGNIATSQKADEVVEMTLDCEKPLVKEGLANENLWLKQVSVTTSSKLFPSTTTTRSSLFPSEWFNPAVGRRLGNHAQFRYIASRIHEALVVAPSMPELAVQSISQSHSEQADRQPQPSARTTTAGAPVASASEARPTTEATKDEIMDNIVTVSRPKQKKRKRARQETDGVSTGNDADEKSQGKKAATKAPPADIVAFDYASAPNFLDTPSDDKRGPQVKRKQPRGRQAFDFSGFSAPPRAMNEVKGANKAHTFK